jgi:hypothetical protein
MELEMVVRDVAELVSGVGGNCLVLNDRGQGSAGPSSLDLDDIDAETLSAHVDEVSEDEDPQAWELARDAYATLIGAGHAPTRVWAGEPDHGSGEFLQSNPHQTIYAI